MPRLIDDIGAYEEPRIGLQDDIGIFDEDAMLPSEKSSYWLKQFGMNVLKGTTRTAGVVIGAMNSPLAFIWGSQAAAEGMGDIPWWKKELKSVPAGLTSAWKSVTKRGDWGTLYGDYYQKVTGKTIEESLPDNLKWSAPTLEALANIVTDPVISMGQAARIAQLRIPKGWIGKLPSKMVEQLNTLDEAEKAVFRTKLMQVFRNRGTKLDYIKWWEKEGLPEIARRSEAEKVAIEKARSYQWPFPGPEARGIERPIREIPEITKKVKEAKILGKIPPRVQQMTAKFKMEEFAKDKGIPISEVPVEELKAWKLQQARKGLEAFRKRKGLPPLRKIAEQPKAIITEINKEMPGNELVYDGFWEFPGKAIQHQFTPHSGRIPGGTFVVDKLDVKTVKAGLARKIAEFKLPPPSKTMALKATGGVMLGVEEDEEGNLFYNPGTGTAAALLIAGGLKFRNVKHIRKAQQTLAKNPAWAKVASGIAQESDLFTKTSGLWNKINIRLFDRFAPLKKISQKTYEAARMYNSYKDQAALKFRALQQAFRPVKKDDFAVSSYIKAHRDMVRAERGLKNPAGVTLTDAKQAIKEIETDWVAKGKNVKDLKDARDSFNQWTHDHILYEGLESGIISQQMYDDIVKNNKWYATYSIADYIPNLDDLPMLPSREYFSLANQDIFKTMKGTEKLIADPIEATIKKFTNAQATFARNRVANMLVDDPAMKSFLRPVARSKKEFGILRNKGLNPVMEGTWSKKDFGIINRFKEGKVDRYIVPIEIADTMKQLSPWQAPRAIQAYNAVFRAAATSKNLAFMIGNVARDAFMAYVTVPAYKTADIFGRFQKDWAKGAWEATKFELGRPSLVDDYVKAGGGFGYAGAEAFERGIGRNLAKQQLFAKTLPRKVATVITGPLDLIEKINNVAELAPRMGTFQRAIKKGYLPKDAALMARQATIDFNRGGTWLKAMNQFVPFLNARVQARVTLATALKRDIKGTAAKAVTATILPGMAAYAWNKLYYADLYEDIPGYIKDNYFTIIYGKTTDDFGRVMPKYFVIAKGDMGQMAFNPIEFGLEQEYAKDPKKILSFAVNYLSDISPVEFAREGEPAITKVLGGLMPPAGKAVLEYATNLNFYTGREIVPYWMEKTKPPELQYKETTPETYKWIGKKIGVSPLVLQNLASNVVAQYGREGLWPAAMLRGLQGRLIKTIGGEIERQAWITIKDIENGYISVRAKAQELVKNGERNAGRKLLLEWNRGLNQRIDLYNKNFSKYGLHEKGNFRRSYYFSGQKMRNALLVRQEKMSPLQKRLRKK